MTVAASYARKSNKEKHATHEVLSTTRQIEQACAYAARNGWVVDERHIYRDEASTGAEFVKRQQFNRLLAAVGAAKTPPFDILILSGLGGRVQDHREDPERRGGHVSLGEDLGQGGDPLGAAAGALSGLRGGREEQVGEAARQQDQDPVSRE